MTNSNRLSIEIGYVWSSVPYEDEAFNILQMIRKLSPIRELNEGVQMISWPENIPQRSAQDSFVFIVNKLLKHSQRLCSLHFKEHKPIKSASKLNRRDYLRCLQLSPNMRVSNEFIHHEKLETLLYEPEKIVHSKNTRIVTTLYHKKLYQTPESNSTSKCCLNGNQLDGLRNIEEVENLLEHNVKADLVNFWIRMYDYAREKDLNHERLALILSLFAHEQNELLGPILAI